MEIDQMQPNILDLSVLSSADDSRSDVSENQYYLRSETQMKKLQKNYQGGTVMSEEEWKIRGELESDIERELEEEIKDGIYHMALRLHRLYQHKRERKLFGHTKYSESGGGHKKDKALSEVNISIKMEGGTKIEIKETKKEGGLKHLLPPRSSSSRSSRSNNNVLGNGSNGKKFDWAKSLRDGAGPSSIIIRRIERLDQAKESSN
ncbi:hypothetical protein CCACVL1_26687 [Corchorus capsularis]|uniref:Uncharacterized protein n=1 Tax=Corchorus capsularis TaxID=210143 RepID=A0A1R3GDS6_COCAP|nr:hypothetical protein CCACVL1_26687 [Corchorus capsularis]